MWTWSVDLTVFLNVCAWFSVVFHLYIVRRFWVSHVSFFVFYRFPSQNQPSAPGCLHFVCICSHFLHLVDAASLALVVLVICTCCFPLLFHDFGTIYGALEWFYEAFFQHLAYWSPLCRQCCTVGALFCSPIWALISEIFLASVPTNLRYML